MAYIDCVVDTQPMAPGDRFRLQPYQRHHGGGRGNAGCRHQSGGRGFEHVCENVNRGFYTLIHVADLAENRQNSRVRSIPT